MLFTGNFETTHTKYLEGGKTYVKGTAVVTVVDGIVSLSMSYTGFYKNGQNIDVDLTLDSKDGKYICRSADGQEISLDIGDIDIKNIAIGVETKGTYNTLNPFDIGIISFTRKR